MSEQNKLQMGGAWATERPQLISAAVVKSQKEILALIAAERTRADDWRKMAKRFALYGTSKSCNSWEELLRDYSSLLARDENK